MSAPDSAASLDALRAAEARAATLQRELSDALASHAHEVASVRKQHDASVRSLEVCCQLLSVVAYVNVACPPHFHRWSMRQCYRASALMLNSAYEMKPRCQTALRARSWL